MIIPGVPRGVSRIIAFFFKMMSRGFPAPSELIIYSFGQMYISFEKHNFYCCHLHYKAHRIFDNDDFAIPFVGVIWRLRCISIAYHRKCNNLCLWLWNLQIIFKYFSKITGNIFLRPHRREKFEFLC